MGNIHNSRQGHRILAFLLALVLMLQAVPVLPVSAAGANGVGDETGVVVSIENYESGKFILEPVRVADNGKKLSLLRAAFRKAGISEPVLEEQQFDWCLDAVMNIQGVRADAYNGSNDTGNRAWLMIRNNGYDLWDYTNWKSTPNHTVIRFVYTTNHGADAGFTGATSGSGSMGVNKDALITAIADARRDFANKTEAIRAAEAVVLNANATQEQTAKALKDLQAALSGGSGEKLERIVIDGDREVFVNVGESRTFTASKEPAGAAGKIQWKVSSDLAAIDAGTGRFVAGPNPGQVTVTAQVGLVQDSVTVTIQVPAAQVEILPGERVVPEGKTLALQAKVLPENTTDKITWSSDAEDVAKVDPATGVVTGVRKGTANITASAGSASASVQITVQEIPATDLTVTPAEITVAVGRSQKAVAKMTPDDATQKVVWAVKSGSELITVDQNGVITAGMTAGEAVVTASVGNLVREIPVHVITIPAQSITLAETLTLRQGKTADLHPLVTPEDTTDVLVWTTDKESVAVVENGIVTAVAPGTANITASAGSVSATVQVTVTEGAYVYFQPADGSAPRKLENGVITLTPVDAGSFKIANYDGEVSFDCDVTRVTDVDGLYSDQYLVHTSGRFQPFGNSQETNFTVSAWADFDGEHQTFIVKLVPSDITQIRLLVGDKVVSGDTYFQKGAHSFVLTVQGKTADGEFRNLPASAVNFYSENQMSATVDSTGTVRPRSGAAKIHADLKCSSVTSWMEASFQEVPVESFEILIPEINYIHAWNSLGGYYVGLQPHSDFQIRYTPANTTQKDLVWEALTPEIAIYMEAFSNGIVPNRGGTARFRVSAAANPEIFQIVEVNFAYKNPVESVTLEKTAYELFPGNTENLLFAFQPGNASEQRFDWQYSEEGIVRVDEFVKTDATGTAEKWFEHQLLALKPGTVTVTGIPMDQTGNAAPITFAVQVKGGSDPEIYEPVDPADLLKHGLDALKAGSHRTFGDEWTIFPMLRAGKRLSINDRMLYLQSVQKELETDKRLQPTDYARIILTLTVMGIDPQNFQGINVVERLCMAPDFFNKTSNQILWSLIALDSHDYEIPQAAGFTREQLLQEVLKFQRPDGSYSLSLKDPTGSVDMTAMMLQGLAGYQNHAGAKAAMEKGVAYLQSKITQDAGFINEGGENSCTAAQVILGLCSMGVDPADPANGFLRNGKNMVSRLEIFRLETGYALLAGQTESDLMAMQQVTAAMEAYRRMAAGAADFYDLSAVSIKPMYPEEVDDQKVADAVIAQIAKLPEKPSKADFSAIYAARQAYDSLSKAQKALVYNYQKLVAAEQYLEDAKEAQHVIDRIEKLPEKITQEHKKVVAAAREAYNKLTDAQKAMVTNLDKLLKAEKKLESHHQNPGGVVIINNVVKAEIKNNVVSAKQFEAVQDKDKLLVIESKLDSGKTYTLKIIGTDVRKAQDMNVQIRSGSRYEPQMTRLAKEPVIFTFVQEGTLPGLMKVELPIDLADGAYFLMRYDPEQMHLEKISKVNVLEGMVEFLVDRGGSYLIAKQVSLDSLKEPEPPVVPETEPEQTAPETVPTDAGSDETVPAGTENPADSHGLGAPAVIGIVAACLLAIAAIVGVYLAAAHKRRKV